MKKPSRRLYGRGPRLPMCQRHLRKMTPEQMRKLGIKVVKDGKEPGAKGETR